MLRWLKRTYVFWVLKRKRTEIEVQNARKKAQNARKNSQKARKSEIRIKCEFEGTDFTAV